MTASNARQLEDSSHRQLEQLCQTAIDGRRAARSLIRYADQFRLGESELEILWLLCRNANVGIDQKTLATQLALSPPQVSACVEKLCSRGLIEHREASGDRRRRLWQASANGGALLREVLRAVDGPREAAA